MLLPFPMLFMIYSIHSHAPMDLLVFLIRCAKKNMVKLNQVNRFRFHTKFLRKVGFGKTCQFLRSTGNFCGSIQEQQLQRLGLEWLTVKKSSKNTTEYKTFCTFLFEPLVYLISPNEFTEKELIEEIVQVFLKCFRFAIYVCYTVLGSCFTSNLTHSVLTR